jgi:hypothetical protein
MNYNPDEIIEKLKEAEKKYTDKWEQDEQRIDNLIKEIKEKQK